MIRSCLQTSLRNREHYRNSSRCSWHSPGAYSRLRRDPESSPTKLSHQTTPSSSSFWFQTEISLNRTIQTHQSRSPAFISIANSRFSTINKPKNKKCSELKGFRFDHQATIASFTSLRSDFGDENLRWRSTVENWIEENQINDACVCLVELLEMILVPEKIRERERERWEWVFFSSGRKGWGQGRGGRSKLYDSSLCMLN